VGGTISPGLSGIGILTVTNGSVNLKGTTVMDINKTTATNDVLNVTVNLVYGGTLNVNITGTLAVNDSFKLFNGGTYSGAFTTVSPATPGPGLAWDTSHLTLDGSLIVKSGSVSTNHLNGITISGTSLSISATNGPANGGWTLLQSTNIALPFAQWDTNRTGTFDGSGNLTTNIANVVTNTGLFYLLKQ